MSARKKNTRHRGLADGMKALLAYRDKPEGPIEPLQTNWTVAPAATNAAPEEIADLPIERSWRMTPSVAEIMRQVAAGPVTKNDAGQIVGIGRLRFSDGMQTERAYTYGPEGKLIGYDARMPAGAMLGTRDKPEAQFGGGENPEEVTASNRYFADVLGTAPHRYKAGGKRKNGTSYTAEQSAEMLAEAWRNTDPAKLTYSYGPPALPCGSSNAADSFNGMKKAAKGESGAIAWEDIASAKVHREVWAETIAALKEEDVETLDIALGARNMHAVGSAAGQSDYYARNRGGGKRRLMAANDNLRRAMRKAAA